MKGLRRYLIFGSLLLVIYLVAQYFKPTPTDWTATYLPEDKIPYGTYILRQRITDIFKGTTVRMDNRAVYNSIKDKPAGSSNLIIIASSVKIDELDYKEMLKYMKAGNNIFISCYQLNDAFTKNLKLDYTSDFAIKNQQKFPVNFVNPALKRTLDYYFEKGINEQYFTKFDTAKAVVLGLKSGVNANFLQYKFGKGALYILPNPLLLTNYNLLKEPGLDYAAKALSYLPQAKTLIWNEHFTRTAKEKGDVLSVLFKYEQMRWAYWIALVSLIAFILFEIKRRQRIIPVIERPKNTTVDFVKVIGRVYYQQRNNKDIVQKKITYLMAYIRNKYRLKTTVIDQEFTKALINIAGAKPELINELFHEINFVNQLSSVSDQQLVHLNKLIEQFYQQEN